MSSICAIHNVQFCSQLNMLSPLRISTKLLQLSYDTTEMTQQHHLLPSEKVMNTTVMHHLLTYDRVHRVTVNFLLEEQRKRKGLEATHFT